jgi:diguanylate cyclase (GGDEF)-like protein
VDLKTSFVFLFLSLALYSVVLVSMALADRRLVGARWLAYAVLIDLVKTVLQGMAGTIPPVLSTMVADELNLAAFFSMYMGFRWFVLRTPLRSTLGPVTLLITMALYCAMYLLRLPYGFLVVSLPVLWMCGATIRQMLVQKEERFRLPVRIAIPLLLTHIILLWYRMALSVLLQRQSGSWTSPVSYSINDPRWTFSTLSIIILSTCLVIMYVWFAAAEIYSTVEASAGMDALTGCMNRRSLMKLAGHELARSERTTMPLSIVALDLDHFKEINDTYGHAAGDAMLCALVSLLKTRLRSVDVVARTGGEEFLLLLPDTDALAAAGVMRELLPAVEHMRVEHEGHNFGVTVSAGITERLPRGDVWTTMMNRADHALYAAKAAGRNCLVLDEAVVNLPRTTIPKPVHGEVVSLGTVALEDSGIRMMWKRRV